MRQDREPITIDTERNISPWRFLWYCVVRSAIEDLLIDPRRTYCRTFWATSPCFLGVLAGGARPKALPTSHSNSFLRINPSFYALAGSLSWLGGGSQSFWVTAKSKTTVGESDSHDPENREKGILHEEATTKI
ncbi:hypothetical protein [Paraburkholderia sp. J10-1]|uniref:hypothetical protein n=1 Tax=Paraburkholderia sp. J10-1 TaxID=2805430 RepID=UPI002AB6C780|nr:hypothetical protein [Paraburkholderia sp. J10-1]